MSATNRHPPQIPSDEESAQAGEAGRQLARLLPEGERPLRLVTEGDGREMISIPPAAARLFLGVLTQLGHGRESRSFRGRWTEYPGSRGLFERVPSVRRKLIESGKLPARLVGTRRQVSFTDLIKFDEEDRKTRRASLDELARIDQELKL
jgi:hypothetical protein